METKNIVKIVIAAAAVYGIVYFYQRYQRQKANESVVNYDEAVKKIDDL